VGAAAAGTAADRGLVRSKLAAASAWSPHHRACALLLAADDGFARLPRYDPRDRRLRRRCHRRARRRDRLSAGALDASRVITGGSGSSGPRAIPGAQFL
jgi:hypothetical protein